MYYVVVFLGLFYEWTRHRYPAEQSRNSDRDLGSCRSKAPHCSARPLAAPLCTDFFVGLLDRYKGLFTKTFLPATASIVILFLLRLALVHYAAVDDRAPQWLLHLPIVPLYDSPSLRYTTYRQSIALCLALIGVASCIALFLLYRAFEARAPQRREWAILSISCAIMSVSAIAAPALSSTDPYFYSAYGERGFRTYGSREILLPCPIPHADPNCMRPTLPNVYGPLYTTYLETLLRHIKSTLFRIEALRISNVLWVSLFILLLRALNLGSPLIAISMINPAILTQYIGEAHNDIIAVDLLLLGSILVKRFPFVSLIFVTSAALIKLPFALFGAFAFQSLPIFTRSAWAAATIVLSLALSFLWGKQAYVESLLYYIKFHQFSLTFEHRAIALAGLVVIAFGFFKNRFSIAGAYTLPALAGGSAFPWYSLWAIPYLLQANRSKLAFFLITLPMTSFLMETPFQIPALWCAVILILTAVVIRRILRRGMPTLERESP